MDKVKAYAKEYQAPLIGGVSGVVIGIGAKRLLKKEIFPVGSVRRVIETFLLITLSGVIGLKTDEYLKKPA